MNKVFVVQELKRYHCPECDSSYSKPYHEQGEFVGFKCGKCQSVYKHGVAKPRDSLTEAAVYGDIEVLFTGNSVGIGVQPIAIQFRNKLRNYDDGDYLLPVGDPVLIGIAAVCAARANAGRVKFLRWDKQTRNYIKVEATV